MELRHHPENSDLMVQMEKREIRLPALDMGRPDLRMAVSSVWDLMAQTEKRGIRLPALDMGRPGGGQT